MKNGVFWDVTRRNIPEDAILHNHRRENFKSYKKDMVDHNNHNLKSMQ
jgi:hypothetical protein